MKKPKVQVAMYQGEIPIGAASWVRNLGPNAQEWLFDLDAKYAEVAGTGSGDGSEKENVHELYLDANVNTLYTTKAKAGQMSVIEFKLPKGWGILMETISKYTCKVLVGKHGTKYQTVEMKQVRHKRYQQAQAKG